MSEYGARKLDFRRKLLLWVAGLLAVTAPVIFGLVNATPSQAQSENASATLPTFESVSIKPSVASAPMPTYGGSSARMMRMMYGPDGFVADNVTLKTIIQEAYGVQANQITGGPEWLDSARFDMEAKVSKSETNRFGLGPYKAESQQMLEAALADQTKLALHRETKELPSYALVVVDGGPKLQLDKSAENETGGIKGPDGRVLGIHRMQMQMGSGQVVGMAAQGVSVQDFAEQLSRQLGAPVVDKTGLKGSYDFTLQWKPGVNQSQGNDGDPAAVSTGAPGASGNALFTAIQEQLGLKLEPQKAPMEVLVIDHIEKPTEN